VSPAVGSGLSVIGAILLKRGCRDQGARLHRGVPDVSGARFWAPRFDARSRITS
jgi:hypothetical protein